MPRGTALVTGAASGIGRCFADRLAADGYDLVLLDVDAAGLAETVRRIGDEVHVASAVASVADRAELASVIGALLPPEGNLDLLINCAAILGPGMWARQPADEFEHVLDVDFLGTANAVRSTLPWLRRARGQIVILASTAAMHGWPGLAAYSAAKFAIVGYTEGIRPELARDGIGVTVVFPLLIDTPLLERPGTPLILKRGRRIPAERVVTKSLRAAARRKRRVFVPATVRVVAALQGFAPSLLDWYGARFGMPRGRAARDQAP